MKRIVFALIGVALAVAFAADAEAGPIRKVLSKLRPRCNANSCR